MSHPAHRAPGTAPAGRLRRGIGALAAGVGALVLQGDVGVFHVGVALAVGLLAFELVGRAFSRWAPSKDPNDYRG
jgi:hypothetical protein